MKHSKLYYYTAHGHNMVAGKSKKGVVCEEKECESLTISVYATVSNHVENRKKVENVGRKIKLIGILPVGCTVKRLHFGYVYVALQQCTHTQKHACE